MNKSHVFKLCIIVFLLFLTSLHAKPNKITLAYQNTINYPFQTGNSNEINWEKPGTLLELFKIVEKKLNIKIVFVRVPWKRALFDLKDGTVDGLFEASYKQKRLSFGVYPTKDGIVDEKKRTNYNSYYLYKRLDSSLTWDGVSFKNISKGICAEREYSIVDDLRKMGVAVHEFNDTTKCMELLKNKRVEGVAALERAADSILSKDKNMYKEIIKLKPALQTKAYYLMLSHRFVNKYPKFSEVFWDTVSLVRDSKEMEIIRKNYY